MGVFLCFCPAPSVTLKRQTENFMTACVLPYHGGKARIASDIATVLDRSRCEHYCEPFAGGLAVLFASRRRKLESINDKTNAVATFWQVVATQPEAFHAYALARAVRSEHLFTRASEIVKGKAEADDDIELAWALWFGSCVSFGHVTGAAFGYSIKPVSQTSSLEARLQVLFAQAKRIQHLQIFNRCALDLLSAMSSPDVLLYCDPPYIGTGASAVYSDFSADDLGQLCDLLRAHEGEWALSGYDHPHMMALADEFQLVDIETVGAIRPAKQFEGKRRRITERLVTNIEPNTQQLTL